MEHDEAEIGEQQEPGVSRYGFAIEPGWPVYSADELWLGEVKDVADTYILVTPHPHHRGSRNLYIPISTVQSFEAGRVVVNYPYQQVVGNERFCHPPEAERPQGRAPARPEIEEVDREGGGETEAEQHPELYSP